MNKKKVEKEVKEVKISKEEQIKILEEDLLRSKAEFINFKKRRDDETMRYLKYANEDLLLGLLPVIDDFERAVEMNDSHSEEVIKYKEGVLIIHDKLSKVLTDFEVFEIESLNQKFDPALHQAVITEKDKKKKSGIILGVLQKGYMLKDKVIRPTMVKVNNLEGDE